MAGRKGNKKGTALEELLRAYFLRAGFFVVRGVPIRLVDEELTDVDLWLYERPTGTARRVQIVDIKSKTKPKAIERMFWTRGLADALDVDGAYVATTDRRDGLRKIASKLSLTVIDGTDIQRIRESNHVLIPNRITDEELAAELSSVDDARKSKELYNLRSKILGTLSAGFGPASVAASLNLFQEAASISAVAYPKSKAAVAAGRLAYLAAAIACASVDFVSVATPFRSNDERRDLILNAVRYGAMGLEEGKRTLRVAIELIRKYAPSGSAVARRVESAFQTDLNGIPAEIVADQSARMLKDGQLFVVGRALEQSAYAGACPPFDKLSGGEKAFIGALLDYSGIKRETFACAWTAEAASDIGSLGHTANQRIDQQSLFREGSDSS